MHTAFGFRKKLVEAKRAKDRADRDYSRLVAVDRVATQYEKAYEDLHGMPIDIAYLHGWYLISKGRYREKEVVAMTEVLQARKNALDNPPPMEYTND